MKLCYAHVMYSHSGCRSDMQARHVNLKRRRKTIPKWACGHRSEKEAEGNHREAAQKQYGNSVSTTHTSAAMTAFCQAIMNRYSLMYGRPDENAMSIYVPRLAKTMMICTGGTGHLLLCTALWRKLLDKLPRPENAQRSREPQVETFTGIKVLNG
jgi:hypothetical protein